MTRKQTEIDKQREQLGRLDTDILVLWQPKGQLKWTASTVTLGHALEYNADYASGIAAGCDRVEISYPESDNTHPGRLIAFAISGLFTDVEME